MRPRRHASRGRAFDLGRVLASLVLGVLVLVGAASLAVPLLYRAAKIRGLIAEKAAAAVKAETGVDVSLKIDRALWPPGVVVRDVVVASSRPGHPFAAVREARVSLKPFGLLSGNVAIDAIELDQLEVDVEVVDGKLVNLPLALAEHRGKPVSEPQIEPPFRVIAVTGARVKATVKSGDAPADVVELVGIDFDVDVLGEGTFEYDVRLHKATGVARTAHTLVSRPPRADRFAPGYAGLPPPAPRDVLDDDAICELALQVHVSDRPTARIVHLRRLEAEVRLDVEEGANTEVSCLAANVPADRLATIRLDNFDVEVPKTGGQPRISTGPSGGKLRVRAPAILPARYVPLPEVGGWVQADLDIVASIDLHNPIEGVLRANASGKIEAHDPQVAQYHLGSVLIGDVAIKAPLLVSSKRIDLRFGDGEVLITDLEVKPLVAKVPLKATVAVKGLSFPWLMRELGVSAASYVRWDIVDAHAKIEGHLDPITLDGPLTAKTRHFELAQAPIEHPGHGHVIGLNAGKGVTTADLTTHIAIRPDRFGFEAISARFGASRLSGRVAIFFDNNLEVDATSDQIDLSDASPLVTFRIGGVGKIDLKVRGNLKRMIQGDGTANFDGFVFDQFALGNVESTRVHFAPPVIEISEMRARYADSRYEVSSMRIDLGRPYGTTIDALVKSPNFDLEDLYAILKLKTTVGAHGELIHDPRWDEISGHLGFDARARFELGGKDDPCGGGRLDIDTTAKFLSLDLYGERYDGGSADVSIAWIDRAAGALGMDLDLHAATLKKKGGGTVVVSGTMNRGGRLNMKATVGGLSLRSLSSMPATTLPIEATADAVATIGGTIETMSIDADVHVSPLRVADKQLPESRFHLTRAPLPTLAPPPLPGPDGCYRGRKVVLFDPARAASDPVLGEYAMTGDLFGGQVRLEDFRITDQTAKVAHGRVAVRDLDLGPLTALRPRPAMADLDEHYGAITPPVPFEGKVSGDVLIVRYPTATWWQAVGTVTHLKLDARQGDFGVATSGETPTLTFGDEGTSIPETKLDVRFGDTATQMVVAASVDRTRMIRGGSPALRARIELPLLPLSRLEALLPGRVERAEGTAQAVLEIGGSVASPTWSGELSVEKAGLTMKGVAMPLVGLSGKVRFDPRYGIRVVCHRPNRPKDECTVGEASSEGCECLHGEMGGGTIDLSGAAELNGFKLGAVDVKLAARAVHFRYGVGLSMTFDADLRVTWSPPETGAIGSPARLEGVVDVESFLYERPVKVFDVNTIQAAKRTDVEAYDPTRDSVQFDVEIRSKRGFRIRNNLVDATVAIGANGQLRAVGTNQRYGLIGDLVVKPGGVFKFRKHDFEIREGSIRFETEDRIEPVIDVFAVTEFHRATTTGSGGEWRIKLHAYGTSNDLKLELTSEPTLSQEDAILLLTIGLTRAEASQVGGSVAGGAGLDFLANIAGVDETLKQAIPIIDDVRFGTAYSVKTGRTEPQVTLGKRLSDSLRASVTSGFGERREVLSNIEWQLSRRFSLQGSYDNVNDVSSASIGNVGLDLRYRLEF